MEGQKRQGLGRLCMVIGALLVAAAALLVGNQRADVQAGQAAAEVLPALQTAIQETQDRTSDTVTVAGSEYLGYLSLPTLGLVLPVQNQWDEDRLGTSPCRYYGSLATEDLVICGHNYTRHFGTLKNLRVGDPVLLTAADGSTQTYLVAALETMPGTQISQMLNSGYPLTLYTCTYGGQSRLAVRCAQGSSD